MEEQHVADDQSHYEISLTAGQAFVAFVLLLLSLAAAFAFGLTIGKGQGDERLVVREKAPDEVTEAGMVGKKNEGKIVELGVADDDFVPAARNTPATDTTATEPAAVTETATANATVVEEAAPALQVTETQAPTPAPVQSQPIATTPSQPWIAQLLSTSDQKTAEALAVKVINGGFNSAYVERGATDKGAVYRVRVKFTSEPDARAAEAKLKAFAPDVWITAAK